MASPEEIQRLQRIRNDLETVGINWSIEADGNELRLCAADPIDGEIIPIAKLMPDLDISVQNFLVGAASAQRFALDMLDRCAGAYRDLARRSRPEQTRNQSRDYAAECAMKCQNDQAFRRYLIERHDLPDAGDTMRIKVRVRGILAIQSMKELNDDATAADRWKALRADFDMWRRR